jgi:hypothetical protein
MGKEVMKTRKINWQYWWARKFSASRFEIVIRNLQHPWYWKEFRVRLRDIMIVPEAGNEAGYVNLKEANSAARRIFEKITLNWNSFQRYMKLVVKGEQDLGRLTRAIVKRDFRRISSKELFYAFAQWDKINLDFFLWSIWIPFWLEYNLPDEASRALQQYFSSRGEEGKFNEYFSIIFSAREKTAIPRELEDLLKIVIRSRGNIRNARKDLETHTAKFQWIPCYDVADEPWDVIHFKKEFQKLARVGDAASRLRELNHDFTKKKKDFKVFIKRKDLPSKTKDLLRMAHEISFEKDNRDDYRRRTTFQVRPLWQEIARRSKVSLKEAAQMIRQETEEFLLRGKFPGRLELERRASTGYLLYSLQGS